eukprot:scaffold28922_cov64-Cyclotella_meneghiniana.AAC.3
MQTSRGSPHSRMVETQRIHSAGAGASNPLPWNTAVASFMTIGDGARIAIHRQDHGVIEEVGNCLHHD